MTGIIPSSRMCRRARQHNRRSTRENLGQIREVLITGSNDVYVVESSEGAEILLPAVHHVVKQIDIAAGQVLVHLINGLR